jgi:thiol-disulfide isomerase/thioredoxin
MMFPRFGVYLELIVSRLTSRFGSRSGREAHAQFWAGFVTGLSLGLVWAPCAGPIFASIAVLTATGQVTGTVVLLTLAYVLGLGIPLFIFAYGGQRIFTASRKINRYTGRVQQAFGVVMILTALAIYTNYDKVFGAKLLNAFPSFSRSLNSFESNAAITKELDALKGVSRQPLLSVNELFNINQTAPEIHPANTWLNTDEPLTIAGLKGKVVLVDFWTYTCINCIRTLPHVTKWYDTYKDKGFIVLGIHTPEFEFEKEKSNVEAAIKQYSIQYPVAQDNNYLTWNNFANQYWPAEYLIDKDGVVRRVHFGEGEYDIMEDAIRTLLGINGAVTSTAEVAPKAIKV